MKMPTVMRTAIENIETEASSYALQKFSGAFIDIECLGQMWLCYVGRQVDRTQPTYKDSEATINGP